MHNSTSHRKHSTNSYHLFNIQDLIVAFPSQKVMSILPKHSLIETNNGPKFLLGFDKSSQVPVIDIFKTFEIKWKMHTSSYAMLVQASLWDSNPKIVGQLNIGFFVDEYFGRIDIHPTRIKRLNNDKESLQSGIVKMGEKLISIIDLDNLFSRQKFKELYSYIVHMNSLN